jgi:hypothetical protein
MAQVIKQCRLIVWDECSMSHRKGSEAVDRTLRDLRDCNLPMGGITVVLSGDFRQKLPVVPKGTKADQLLACLKSSPMWPAVRTLSLSHNMRARLSCHPLAERFATTLLQLGEGKTTVDDNGVINCPGNRPILGRYWASTAFTGADNVVKNQTGYRTPVLANKTRKNQYWANIGQYCSWKFLSLILFFFKSKKFS